MNTDQVSGKFDQVKGKVKQGVGEAVGNQKLANEGVVDQVKGSAKEVYGNVKDAVQHNVEADRREREKQAYVLSAMDGHEDRTRRSEAFASRLA